MYNIYRIMIGIAPISAVLKSETTQKTKPQKMFHQTNARNKIQMGDFNFRKPMNVIYPSIYTIN